MASITIAPRLATAVTLPRVRHITIDDLRAALAKGFDDFKEFPSHAVFLCLIYPIVGLVLCKLAFGYDILPMIFPMIAGFALVGPFAAVGLYEMSRRRERGEEVTAAAALGVFQAPAFGKILMLGVIVIAIFFAWLGAANVIYASHFDPVVPPTAQDFARQVFDTDKGVSMIVIGNAVGFLFAVLTFTVTAVSFPMLLDRNCSVPVAVLTSIRAVLANPWAMAVWAAIIAGGLIAGALPFFMGLAVVLPVLGHATWHLYKRVVV